MDVLYGRNPVLEALRTRRPARRIVLAEGVRDEARLSEILELAQAQGITVDRVARGRLDDIAHTEHHQGVAGYFHARQALRIDELLQRAHSPALLLVLDGIQDPQNLGAIARSAEACAVDGMVLARRRATTVTPAAAKASAGATEHVAVAVESNLANALVHGSIVELPASGVWRVGLDPTASLRYDSVDYTQPVALVVGAEGEGLRSVTRSHCDALVSIPMLGRVESLNAGASAAVLLYEVQRQRGFAPR